MPRRDRAAGLGKSFGGVVTLDAVSADALPGQVTALLGPNGAGKTTVLRMLLGLITPSTGTATFDDSRYGALAEPVRRVGAARESSGAHPGRTALDHLRILAGAVHRRVGAFSLGKPESDRNLPPP